MVEALCLALANFSNVSLFNLCLCVRLAAVEALCLALANGVVAVLAVGVEVAAAAPQAQEISLIKFD